MARGPFAFGGPGYGAAPQPVMMLPDVVDMRGQSSPAPQLPAVDGQAFGATEAKPASEQYMHGWIAKDGWRYTMWADYSIMYESPDGVQRGRRKLGDASHIAIIEQWIREFGAGDQKHLMMYQILEKSRKAAGGTGLIGTIAAIPGDVASALIGGAQDPLAPPEAKKRNKPAMFVGGAVVAVGLAGVAWWWLGSRRKNPLEEMFSRSATPEKTEQDE